MLLKSLSSLKYTGHEPGLDREFGSKIIYSQEEERSSKVFQVEEPYI